MQNNFQSFASQITNPIKHRAFLLFNLPSAFFSGIKVASISEDKAVVTVAYKWFTKNPFRSVYFAVLAMAAEISTGVLAMGHLYKRNPSVSMLVVNMNASFHKKATGLISFVCDDGLKVQQAIEQTVASGEGITVNCQTKGYNAAQELVCEFMFTWSFKAKSKK
jgi:acyl-coenzyme A thioesterase PaaI-like protein